VKGFKLSRKEAAKHVRDGALRIDCQACGSRMRPDESDRIKCIGCGKALASGDHMIALRDIPPPLRNVLTS
jgi:ribosomal protein S27E